MSEVPVVKVLEPLTPSNKGNGEEALIYNGLALAINEYRPSHYSRLSGISDSEVGSLEELKWGQQLASEYLLWTSEQVNQSNDQNHDLWADRFTQASIEIYGEPEKVEAARLVKQKYDWLLTLKEDEKVSQDEVNFLLDIYAPIVQSHAAVLHESEKPVDYQRVVEAYNEAMLEKFKPVFDLVDQADLKKFTPKDIKLIFEQALKWLAENDDPDWQEWEITEDESTKLMVQPEKRRIKVGLNRSSATPDKLKGLLAHELLTHALRAKNGYKTGDQSLAVGFPESNNMEEGVAKIAELGFSHVSSPPTESYLEIALALGTLEGNKQRSRKELYQIIYAHKLLKTQEKGDDISSLSKDSWKRADEVYRGGRGDEKGTRHAIYTKNLVYLNGPKHAALYILGQLDAGKTPVEIFAYINQGKFDPTNQAHVKRIKELGCSIL